MFVSTIKGISVKTKVEVQCDDCDCVELKSINQTKNSRKRRNSEFDYCVKCSRIRGASKRPQNSKKFWEENKQSDAYYIGIKNRPSINGKDNPMWGKTFSDESKLKRKAIWKERTGEQATNWKGGKTSLTFRIKSATQRRYNWFHRVMERDNCTCQHCGDTSTLDVHHIRPLTVIIKQLIIGKEELSDSDKFNWLIIQPEIVDNELANGITLCRSCHRQIHLNWGSHEPKVQER